MSTASIIRIDPTERFPHLPKAPIVEAVIDLRARAEVEWQESSISELLKPKLPDYPKRQSFTGFQQEVTLAPGKVMEGRTVDTGWAGLRFQSEDGLHVAHFNRNGFVFARLRPYDQWEQLSQEAIRLWGVFIEVAKPTEVHRIGLRFVNRIELPLTEVRIEDYLERSPQAPRN